jgi:predicted ATPase
MIIEDAHWIDPSTQEALDLLVPRVADHQILLLITYRPEYPPRWGGEPHVTVLTLNRLTRKLGAQLAERVGGGKVLPIEVLEQIVAKTDGVPLFVEELTKMVLESGYLQEKADHFELTAPLPTLTIPSTLHDILMARLDRLAPIKETAQLGACIGREFSHELIAAISPLSAEQLTEALEQLAQSQLVFRQGIAGKATYTFKHALVQDAAYNSLLLSRRQNFHNRIARALEASFPEVVEANPEVIADHYSRAVQPEVAVRYWLRAGERSRYRMAVEEGLRHLAHALETLGKCEEGLNRDRMEFQIHRNVALLHFIRHGFQSKEAASALRQAAQLISLAKDEVETYCIHMGLLHSVYHRGSMTKCALSHRRP